MNWQKEHKGINLLPKYISKNKNSFILWHGLQFFPFISSAFFFTLKVCRYKELSGLMQNKANFNHQAKPETEQIAELEVRLAV
jgi:hypothetical protein